MKKQFEFEKPLIEIEEKIALLKEGKDQDAKVLEEIKKLEKKRSLLEEDIYAKLTPWQTTQIARHSERPTTSDYIESLFEDFTELHGDRHFGDDKSIIAGLAKLKGVSVVVIGHQKGRNLKERVERNFGMPHPEGYRKALRLMQLAERFKKPIITFIDTPGAYPGVGAEERGQSEAIAKNLAVMSQLKVPILCVVIGEGGSGGALALAVGDRLLMLQYAIYSVISPEGCAAILWNDESRAEEAAAALKLTAPDLLQMGIIDEIIPEPIGGAHQNPGAMFESISEILCKQLAILSEIPSEEQVRQRYNRLRKIGAYTEGKG
jgi:acetyl-CoA carboxylase carboxyl transferase subunit alpha